MNLTTAAWKTGIYVIGYVAAFLGVNLAMKFAAHKTGTTVFWWWFIGGNVIGFFCTVFLTLALKNQNPNLIYALCIGGGFCMLQLVSFFLFKDVLTLWQWVGIGLIGAGIICLHVRV